MNQYEDFIQGKQKPPSLKSFLDQYRLTNIQTNYGKLASLIPKESRKNHGMDMTLTIQKKSVRNHAIRWRLNKINNLKCACGENLNRSLKHFSPRHEGGCGMISHLITIRRHFTYLKNKKKFRNNYLIIDDILNGLQFDLFEKIMEEIGKYQGSMPARGAPSGPMTTNN